MKDVIIAIAGLAALMLALFIITSLGMGFYLAFSASILFGAACLLVTPVYTIIGGIYFVTGHDLAEQIVNILRTL